MIAIYLGILGLVVFIGATIVYGVRLRQHPTTGHAEQFSRTMHALFFGCLSTPFLVSLFVPGLGHLDEVVGLSPLPSPAAVTAVGIFLGLPGLFFLVSSNRLLRQRGSGANAFRLTQRVVTADVYMMTRNPMSFGYYLCCLSLGLLSGSTVLTTYVLVGLMPAHLFFLKFFEERELELRLGLPYRQYKQVVPFLVPLGAWRRQSA